MSINDDMYIYHEYKVWKVCILVLELSLLIHELKW